MNRNKFLKNSFLASLFFSHESLMKDIPSSEEFKPENFDLNEITVLELQKKMQKGELSSSQITQLYLKRIQAVDQSGPKLNSVIEINPDAVQEAEKLDQERKIGKIRGPLHGIPVLIKDNINSGDRMMTTAGALAMKGNTPGKDAFIIKRLRESGAVLLGKTNLSEWANFRSTLSTSGWSSRGGQTKCPYILDRNPSGSSSGTGSAVAANLCVLGIGTETNGSIVSPSSINGLVGIKPTVGLWSRTGIIPISATQDTAGPMARNVRDASILLGALAGLDMEDVESMKSEGKFKSDYTIYLKPEGLKGKKIGIEKSHLLGNERIVGLFKKAINQMKDQGAEIVEIDIIKSLDEASSAEFTVLQYEFKAGLNHYLNAYPGPMKSLKDIIHFNKEKAEETMPYFQQETLISSESMGDLKDSRYLEALKKTLSSREILTKLMQEHSLDGFCGITNGLACCIDLANGDYDTGFSLSTPAAISGFPHITVPMGMIHDLPIGISFFAGPYQEPQLLEMAYSYEQISLNRKAPRFLERIGF